VSSNSLLINKAQHLKYIFFEMGGKLIDTRFELITFYFDSMLNHDLSRKLKLMGNDLI
jgi:hypothetical protein